MGEVVAIAVPIILAIWTGAGFLAIKHPETYRAFGLPLFIACAIFTTTLFGYAAGIMAGREAVNDFLKGDTFTQSYDMARTAAGVPLVWGLLIGGFALGLIAIGIVGQHIEDQRQEQSDDDGKRGKGK